MKTYCLGSGTNIVGPFQLLSLGFARALEGKHAPERRHGGLDFHGVKTLLGMSMKHCRKALAVLAMLTGRLKISSLSAVIETWNPRTDPLKHMKYQNQDCHETTIRDCLHEYGCLEQRHPLDAGGTSQCF